MAKLIAFALFFQSLSFGAACCGGTANTPNLISGDDATQVSATLLHGKVVAEATVDGAVVSRADADNEVVQTLRVDAATLLSDRFQVGVTLPVTRRFRDRNSASAESTGLGDMAVSLGYEAIPVWEYSEWKPRGHVFFSTTIPTGGSLYDSSALYRVDSRGKGFVTPAVGMLFTKSWTYWDISLLGELHHSFARTVDTDLGELHLTPGWGTSATLGVGVSPGAGDVRLGLSLSPSVDEGVATSGIVDGKGEALSLWAVAAQLSYMASPDLSLSLTYSDQTLIRASSNTALNRTVAFMVQKRWER